MHRPRALAALARYFGDIDLAEEAFGDACVKAVAVWPVHGAPRDPLGWLLATARNAGRDRVRKAQRHHRLATHVADHVADQMADANDPLTDHEPDLDAARDDVLRLLFICCHPALARQDQIALALRIVGGLTVEEIARGFLIKPRTMEQRLTRARRKATENPVLFDLPSPRERGERLREVSLMIYLMFNEGWSTSDSETQIRLTLCEEAIRLARLLVELFPGMGEQVALLALFLFQHARRDARVAEDGSLVALDEQDRGRWDRAAIAEAQALLQKAERIGHAGPYRIQATIAAQHASAKRVGDTDWQAIEALYTALLQIQPSPVVELNHLAALAKTQGPEAALKRMEALAGPLADYRWFHSMRAALLEETGAPDSAIAAYERALDLGVTQAERRVILEKMATLRKK